MQGQSLEMKPAASPNGSSVAAAMTLRCGEFGGGGKLCETLNSIRHAYPCSHLGCICFSDTDGSFPVSTWPSLGRRHLVKRLLDAVKIVQV